MITQQAAGARLRMDDVGTCMAVTGDPVRPRGVPGERQDRPKGVTDIAIVGWVQVWQLVYNH